VWLAGELGISIKHLNQIMQGKAAYRPKVAYALQRVTGLSARSWMYMQVDHQLAHEAEDQ
jgi:HTH-type transcriptional regulator / antitoxin HigA